jgi:F-type H+-transporting ATPase subunit gamma
MAGMREIKMRIKSIKDTRQITKAMKLISAAKLKKARQQLEQTRPFFEKVNETIADILSHSASIDSPYFDLRHQKEARKKAYLIISGDKTLAGGYNHNLLKFAKEKINGDKEALLFVAGQIGRGNFIREKYNVCRDFLFPVQNVTVYRAREIQDIILERFRNGEIDEVDLIYTKMKSSISLEPTIIKLLPLDIEGLRSDTTGTGKVADLDGNLTYEPTPEAVLDVLIPKYIKGIVYGAMVEGFTSEQSARMTAMDNATANADEMLQKLNLYYNRARQAMITQEVTEIVSGAEALK